MNLLLFLNSDIHAAHAFELLLPTIKDHKLKIILSKKVGNADALSPELQEMKKLESAGAEEKFLDLAAMLESDIESLDDVNSAEALMEFRKFAPDLILSIRFGQIFQRELIKIPRRGILNLHSGVLPKYRGVLATFWAILNKEKNIGTTLHYISDPKIDTGDVIGFSTDKIDFELSLLENVHKLYKGGTSLLISTLEKIFAGKEILTIKQSDLGAGKYFSYPKEEDIKKFSEIMRMF